MDLANRHVIITGGTGFLGEAVTERLLAAGAHCHVTAFQPSPEVPASWAGNARVRLIPECDVSDEGTVERLYASVDVLWASIHVAGAFAMGPLESTSLATFDRMLSANLRTAFLCTREASRRMTAGGRIVNVAARPALEPPAGAGMIAYSVSKAGVAALTLSSARELHGRGIWVNAVAPSTIDTPPNRAAMPTANHATWPKPGELADTIAWLASPANALTSGTIVPVYGHSWP